MLSGRLIGLRAQLVRPLPGLLGSWAALCGALASNQVLWAGEGLLTLLLVLILVELAWGSLWELGVNTGWFEPFASQSRPAPPAHFPPVLPYTQPGSPGGRLQRRLSRWAGWWRESFWPHGGAALLGFVGAAALAGALAALLPRRVWPLYAALAALIGLGILWRRRGQSLLVGQALVLVGLSWLAGHVAFAPATLPSLALAAAFALAAWGLLLLAAGRRGGLWLVDGGQGAAALLLAVALKQPLAAGVVGLLLFGQAAMQAALRPADEAMRDRLIRRTWPWLAASMLTAAWAIP